MCGLFAALGAAPRDQYLAAVEAAGARGPHAWGIAYTPEPDGADDWGARAYPVVSHHQAGPITDALPQALSRLAWAAGGPLVGHTRLATSGDYRVLRDAQPLSSPTHRLAVAHNGNVYNADALMDALGWVPRTANDSEAVLAGLDHDWDGDPCTAAQSLADALNRVDASSPAACLAVTGTGLLLVARRGQPLWRLDGEGWLLVASRPFDPACVQVPNDAVQVFSTYEGRTYLIDQRTVDPSRVPVTTPFAEEMR